MTGKAGRPCVLIPEALPLACWGDSLNLRLLWCEPDVLSQVLKGASCALVFGQVEIARRQVGPLLSALLGSQSPHSLPPESCGAFTGH